MAAIKPTYNLGDLSHQNTKVWSLICVSYFDIFCHNLSYWSYFILFHLRCVSHLFSFSDWLFRALPRHQKFRTAWASTCTKQLSRVDMAQGLEKWKIRQHLAAASLRCRHSALQSDPWFASVPGELLKTICVWLKMCILYIALPLLHVFIRMYLVSNGDLQIKKKSAPVQWVASILWLIGLYHTSWASNLGRGSHLSRRVALCSAVCGEQPPELVKLPWLVSQWDFHLWFL